MINKNSRLLRISDLERITGIKRSTIHYYLRKGILSPPHRTGKTMAYYNNRHVEELGQIRELQENGLPLAMIKEIKERPEGLKRPWDNGQFRSTGKLSSDKKGKIIQQAVQVFASKGYHKTRISDITKPLGLGHGTFYLYFPSKKAMFIECVDQVFQTMFSGVWERIKHEKDPLKRLRMRGELVLKHHPEFLDILHVLHGTIEDDPRLEAKRKEIYASIAKTVQRDIDKAIECGLLPPINSEVTSYILVGWLETVNLLLNDKKGYTVDNILDILEDIFFKNQAY